MLASNYIHPVVQSGNLAMFWKIDPKRRASLIDLHDLTDVAAKVLNEGSRHYHANYELVGPDKLTPNEMVEDSVAPAGAAHRAGAIQPYGHD